MDESGNTGDNLLDSVQPVFALAGVSVDEDTAEQVIRAALTHTQMTELKFAALRRSAPGRRNILSVIDNAALNVENVAVAVAHKPWMLAAKLVDELVEPRMLAAGRQMEWYASGGHVRMADRLYTQAPRALGDAWTDLLDSFVPLVRNYDAKRCAAFLTALHRARIVARDDGVHEVLELMIDTPAEIEAEFAGRIDALDPAIPLVSWQAGHWSDRLGPFDIVHDDSETVTRWVEELVVANDGEQQPRTRETLTVGDVSITLPYEIRGVRFAQSHRDSRLQLADLLAGSAAHLYAVALGLRPFDGFGEALQDLQVGAFIQHLVGPRLPASGLARLC
jgi:hypothetical protein